MAQHPFPGPGPGHGGDEPVPGVPARDGADEGGEDKDGGRYLDWLTAEIEAGRIEAPPEEEPAPAVLFCVGGDADLAGLAATGFAGHEASDVYPEESKSAAGSSSIGDDAGPSVHPSSA